MLVNSRGREEQGRTKGNWCSRIIRLGSLGGSHWKPALANVGHFIVLRGCISEVNSCACHRLRIFIGDLEPQTKLDMLNGIWQNARRDR